MRFPIDDWQFWVVTVAAILIVIWAGRAMIRRRKPRPRRATLTIGGHEVDKR